MGLDELTAELIKDRIRKRRQAAQSGGTMVPGWKQFGLRVPGDDTLVPGSSSSPPTKRKIETDAPMSSVVEGQETVAKSKAAAAPLIP